MQKDWKEQTNLSTDGSLGYLPVLFHLQFMGEKRSKGEKGRNRGWKLDFEAIMDSENCSIVGEKVIMMKENPGVTRQGNMWT